MTGKPTYEELEQRVEALEKEIAKEKEEKRSLRKIEELSVLARRISHDFNNLLMGIQGRTSMMLLDVDSSHPHFDHLKGIEGNVQSAASLTGELSNFAKSIV